MEISLHSGVLADLATPLLAIPVFKDDRGASFAAADELLDGTLARIADEEGFEAKSGQTLLVHAPQGKAVGRVLLVGMGESTDQDETDVRALGAAAVQEANKRHLTSAALWLPICGDTAREVRFAVEGVELGGYRYDTWRTRDIDELTCTSVAVGGADGSHADLVTRTQAACAGVKLARDLVNGPPVEVTPERLAEVAQEIAATEGLEIEVFDKAEIQRRGMNLLMAVSAGSRLEPRFIHLTYRPEGADDSTPQVALVGKGLTFDAGGYNLKPTGHIEEMKLDMGGGAAVLGAMKAIKAFAPNVIVHGVVPSSENLVSEAAYKPGDVYKALNGKSVEIMNTDAEGRLILADALSFIDAELNVDRVVDMATLTGACVIALGPHIAGLWSNDDAWGERVKQAADEAGENLWPMPLSKKLKAMLKSPIADMKNVGERWGGAITAALFLSEFVGDRTWAHLDIAGPAFADKDDGHIRKGGTGFAVLTLLELVSGEL